MAVPRATRGQQKPSFLAEQRLPALQTTDPGQTQGTAVATPDDQARGSLWTSFPLSGGEPIPTSDDAAPPAASLWLGSHRAWGGRRLGGTASAGNNPPHSCRTRTDNAWTRVV